MVRRLEDAGDRYVARLERIKAVTSLPVIASLNATSPGGWTDHARRLQDAGADGLVLFNRFYQPDLDLETLTVVPRVELSSPAELRLPLRWIASLSPHLAGRASLAATSGDPAGFERAGYVRTLHSWAAPHDLTPSSPSS